MINFTDGSAVSGLTKKRVSRIMATELGLRFKRAKVVNERANLLNSRVQRQRFAVKLIRMMSSGKRVINIDESALNQGQFIRNTWAPRGLKNAHSSKPFGHRLSLIAAMDTHGQVYFAVTQSTVDSEVFVAFLLRLAETLDSEDPDWRDNTVIVLDNASYHHGEETMEALATLRVPTMLAGQYGYDGSPCEKLFAHLKIGDLNPGDISSGKR